jgi:hypothetical protein
MGLWPKFEAQLPGGLGLGEAGGGQGGAALGDNLGAAGGRL